MPIGPLYHSPPAPICKSHVAPGTGIQLSPTHPLHPGRLLIVAIIEEKSLLNRVLRSDDGGSSWLPSNSIEDCGEAQLAELGDGWIYMNCRIPKSKAFAGGLDRGRSVSTDGEFRQRLRRPLLVRCGVSLVDARIGGATFSPIQVDHGTPGSNCMGKNDESDDRFVALPN